MQQSIAYILPKQIFPNAVKEHMSKDVSANPWLNSENHPLKRKRKRHGIVCGNACVQAFLTMIAAC